MEIRCKIVNLNPVNKYMVRGWNSCDGEEVMLGHTHKRFEKTLSRDYRVHGTHFVVIIASHDDYRSFCVSLHVVFSFLHATII